MKSAEKSSQRIVVVRDEKRLRHLLEKGKHQTIVGAESIHHKDSLHYLRSGLDQIACKIARKKGKTIAFSFETLRNSKNPQKQAQLLARMSQNMRLCQKYKVKTKIIGTISDQHVAFERMLKKQDHS